MPAGQDPHPVLVELGERIRARRVELGLSQEVLAERSQLHRTYLPGIEAGSRSISVLVLLSVARALDADPAAFLQGLDLGRRRPTSPRRVGH